MKAYAVIGAGYGDEGKGLITDYLAATAEGPSIVVRFNAGSQAGHTVVTPDGARHVFHHFGSGTFAGAETRLSKFFVCNPIMFQHEYTALAQLRRQFRFPSLRVSADSHCYVTTPYDIMINQMIEEARGKGRHGSCGVGFGETIERHEKSTFHLDLYHTAMALNNGMLEQSLRMIRDHWVPRRLAALGVTPSKAWLDRIANDGNIDRFVECVRFFVDRVDVGFSWRGASKDDTIIFEGAQGLMLDQDYGEFPHVTRSNTGLKNIMPLLDSMGLDALDVLYASRCYATRHGAGPFTSEIEPYDRIVDKTNAPNQYQGAIRFGNLNLNVLCDALDHDLATHGDHRVMARLALTCLDQVDEVTFRYNDELKTASPSEFIGLADSRVLPVEIASYGPTRQTISTKLALPV